MKGSTLLGGTTVDGQGNWVLRIPAAMVQPEEKVSFKFAGALAEQSITFVNGGWSPSPGLNLTKAVTGVFLTAPAFSANGQAAVVFSGGTVDQLHTATAEAGATGAWAQDTSGGFQLLVPAAPAFVLRGFKAAFPDGFPTATAITLTA